MGYSWQEVEFGGELGEKFGSTRKWRVRNLADVIAFADAIYKDFRKYFSPRYYCIFVGEHLLTRDEALNNIEFVNIKGAIRFEPVVEGSGWMDIANVVLGVALVALAIWNPAFIGMTKVFSQVMMGVTGAAMIAAGAAGIMSNAVQSNDGGNEETASSFIFTGPTLRMKSGNPVPIILGRGYVGATRVMERIVAEEAVKIA